MTERAKKRKEETNQAVVETVVASAEEARREGHTVFVHQTMTMLDQGARVASIIEHVEAAGWKLDKLTTATPVASWLSHTLVFRVRGTE